MTEREARILSLPSPGNGLLEISYPPLSKITSLRLLLFHLLIWVCLAGALRVERMPLLSRRGGLSLFPRRPSLGRLLSAKATSQPFVNRGKPSFRIGTRIHE
jgi:hypothetical protein